MRRPFHRLQRSLLEASVSAMFVAGALIALTPSALDASHGIVASVPSISLPHPYINPQPLPPGDSLSQVMINPQPLPPGGAGTQITVTLPL